MSQSRAIACQNLVNGHPDVNAWWDYLLTVKARFHLLEAAPPEQRKPLAEALRCDIEALGEFSLVIAGDAQFCLDLAVSLQRHDVPELTEEPHVRSREFALA